MSDFNSLVQYTVENISRPVKYIIYKLTEFIRVVDKFVFRQVPAGAASGYATIEQVEGNTVVWNQLVQNGNFATVSNWTAFRVSYTVSNNIAEIIVNSGQDDGYIVQAVSAIQGHKYFICGSLKAGANKGRLQPSGVFASVPNEQQYTAGTGNFERLAYITQANSTGNGNIQQRNYDTATPLYARDVICFDLSKMFGSGNEPTTVAEFEAWLAQNIGTLPYYDYNASELLSVKMSGMQTEDSSQQTLDTIALDVTTITGINTATNVRETIFPNGMKQADRAGTSKDVLDLRSDTATVNVGSRAYQSGDESDTSVITDGTSTYYALTTPIEYTDLQDANGNPLNPRYKVEQGGTEQVLPVNTNTPTTVAPTLTTIYKKNI